MGNLVSALAALARASFTYPGAARPSLRDVTLEVGPGELVVVSGPAGAGCSTLLLVLSGFAPRLTGGRLEGGRSVAAARPGVVFATPWTQLTGMCYTVAAEVAFGPASRGLPPEAVREAADAAMRKLGIGHLGDRDPATLSGGELQRVVIAASLAMEPDLLVLDDPAAELDPEGADALYELLADLGAGTAVVVATPDLERAARVARRAVALQDGRIVADGAPADVLADTDTAVIARAAGCPSPWPLDVSQLVSRVDSLAARPEQG
jgi:energy-coupling factor transporter ATP-binding protein EcfA2